MASASPGCSRSFTKGLLREGFDFRVPAFSAHPERSEPRASEVEGRREYTSERPSTSFVACAPLYAQGERSRKMTCGRQHESRP